MFCQYMTKQVGMCCKWVSGNKNLCQKHNGMKPVVKSSGRRFRGDSKFAKEIGMFKNKGE